ncbi:hypothetical protein HLB23_11460 [Nocardia uniformis]|uniref:PucR C-terminal helix-turn-helix domain-containing protein n=1 Tax=Nocardia uniformis TaxID=53432 RepID=A0A849BV76_9NOCA|nr:GMC oxidoreductase [Nocardia uniformis]NNH70472.1 hypothetical protein [Nocardia uniformis]
MLARRLVDAGQPTPAWAAQGLEAQLFATTRPGLIAPDIQPLFLSWVYPLVAQLLHPYSRGEMRLRSADPTDAPRYDPRVFSDPRDLETLVDNLELLREIAAQEALYEWIDVEAIPGPGLRSREQLRDHARATVVSGHHQIGTARMGLDAASVVDAQLRALIAAQPELAADVLADTITAFDGLHPDDTDALVRTALAWFEFRGSTAAVGKRLHLHRNTVLHRLERIEKLTGAAFAVPAGAALLYVTLQAWLLRTPGEHTI